MITEYFRPKNLEEALSILTRPDACPLGGGTVLNQPSEQSFAVVDLQALGLDKLHKSGNHLDIGATVHLQTLLESNHTPDALKTALKLEAPLNLRNMGTVAGALVAADGRSPFAAVMLALDAKIDICNSSMENQKIPLGELLPLREEQLRAKLITRIEIPLNIKLAYESVARTPADRPIVCAALAQWPSGRTRLVIAGWGSSPTVAMDGDGNEISAIEAAAQNAAQDADDEWAPAEYRRDVAAVLAKRCLDKCST